MIHSSVAPEMTTCMAALATTCYRATTAPMHSLGTRATTNLPAVRVMITSMAALETICSTAMLARTSRMAGMATTVSRRTHATTGSSTGSATSIALLYPGPGTEALQLSAHQARYSRTSC